MVIMARAKKSRKQWRPKAMIQSAAAQHRTNVDNIVTTLLHDNHGIASAPVVKDTHGIAATTILNQPLSNKNETVLLIENTNHPNSLISQLTPAMRPSINNTSSSGEQLDDDERDDIALFVHKQQTQMNDSTHDKPSDLKQASRIVVTTPLLIDDKQEPDFEPITNTCGSQTENSLPCHYPAKRIKTRLKTTTNTSRLSTKTLTTTTTTILTDNTVKTAKRKAYSRMKKERKATQTLIIVLSKFMTEVKNDLHAFCHSDHASNWANLRAYRTHNRMIRIESH
jgi:hypothetical protein